MFGLGLSEQEGWRSLPVLVPPAEASISKSMNLKWSSCAWGIPKLGTFAGTPRPKT